MAAAVRSSDFAVIRELKTVAICVGIKIDVTPIKVIYTTHGTCDESVAITASSCLQCERKYRAHPGLVYDSTEFSLPEDGDRRFLRNAGAHRQDCAVS